MEKALITYETIYEFLRNEKGKEELQTLQMSFFDDVSHYLTEKERFLKETEAKTDVFSQQETEKMRVQIHHTRALLTDLYTRRERKMVDMAINTVRTRSRAIDTSALHVNERPFFDAVVGVLEQYRGTLLVSLLKGRPFQKPVEQPRGKTVEFISSVDTFVDTELNEFGPFASGDRAIIPNEIADILIMEGKAREA